MYASWNELEPHVAYAPFPVDKQSGRSDGKLLEWEFFSVLYFPRPHRLKVRSEMQRTGMEWGTLHGSVVVLAGFLPEIEPDVWKGIYLLRISTRHCLDYH